MLGYHFPQFVVIWIREHLPSQNESSNPTDPRLGSPIAMQGKRFCGAGFNDPTSKSVLGCSVFLQLGISDNKTFKYLQSDLIEFPWQARLT